MGVGSQTASMRSASIGPFGSLTPSGELLKLLVSEFQSSFVSKLPLPFLAAEFGWSVKWLGAILNSPSSRRGTASFVAS
jgi:hypothetical protein